MTAHVLMALVVLESQWPALSKLLSPRGELLVKVGTLVVVPMRT